MKILAVRKFLGQKLPLLKTAINLSQFLNEITKFSQNLIHSGRGNTLGMPQPLPLKGLWPDCRQYKAQENKALDRSDVANAFGQLN